MCVKYLRKRGITTTEYHPYPDFRRDFEKELQALEEVEAVVPQTNRYHPTFSPLKHILFEQV